MKHTPYTLYIKDNCAYSAAALHALEELGVHANIKNVRENRYAMELMDGGGKFQLPCLYDSDNDLYLYDSGAIVEYLENHFHEGKHKKKEEAVNIFHP